MDFKWNVQRIIICWRLKLKGFCFGYPYCTWGNRSNWVNSNAATNIFQLYCQFEVMLGFCNGKAGEELLIYFVIRRQIWDSKDWKERIERVWIKIWKSTIYEFWKLWKLVWTGGARRLGVNGTPNFQHQCIQINRRLHLSNWKKQPAKGIPLPYIRFIQITNRGWLFGIRYGGNRVVGNSEVYYFIFWFENTFELN